MNNSTLVVSPSRLSGVVEVSGAKNSALRLLAASLLTRDELTLNNFPAGLLDAQTHLEMLSVLGKSVENNTATSVTIREAGELGSSLVWDGRSIRNTLLILGALVARTGKGAVPVPGGCDLGERKFDLHELVLRSLGAEVWVEHGMLVAEATGGLTGTDIHLPLRSTGATENAILAGSLARGTTRIWNPHVRPEILDLIAMLNSMGAKIRVFGQEHIEVSGVDTLHGTVHSVIPDNMEAITWLAAAAITGGDIEIRNFPVSDLEVVLAHLKASGAKIFVGPSSVIVRDSQCYPFDISTGPHPGINSDVQPILAAWAACATGESRIIDLRFPGRYGYATEMGRMGVRSVTEGGMLRIFGNGGNLTGAHVRALDLRAGAALALCGLRARGETRITDAWQITRGYESFDQKLRLLGANASFEA